MPKTGSFDFNFPGANLICDTPQKRASLLKYLNGGAQSIDVPLSYSNIEQDVNDAFYNTTYIHEGKHFHDHLLCPYLLHNYALKIKAFVLANLAIYSWNNGDKPYKWIPVPLSNWINLPIKNKLILLKKKGINNSDVPIFSTHEACLLSLGKNECQNEFTKFLVDGAIHYGEYLLNMGQLSPTGEKTDLTIKNFGESLAYNQQLTEIFLKYGADYGGKIINSLLNESFYNVAENLYKSWEEGKTGNYDNCGFSVYSGPLFLTTELARATNINSKFLYPFNSYVLFWALSGSRYDKSLWAMFPRNRIEALIHVANKSKKLKLNQEKEMMQFLRSPFKTYNLWDKCIEPVYKVTEKELSSFLNTYNIKRPVPLSFEKFYEKYIHSFSADMRKIESLGLFWPSFYIYQITHALFRMSYMFRENPWLYLYPEAYSKNLHMFVNVPFRFDFQNVSPIREDECKNIRKGITLKDNYIYGDSLLPNEQEKAVDWRALEAVSQIIDFTDSLFGFTKINRPGALIKNFLPGINPWFFQNSL